MTRKTIPYAGRGSCKGSASDGGEPDRWHHETVGASRAQRLTTRQVGNSDKRTEVLRTGSVQHLIRAIGY